ncbi:hypothetical protein MNBD_GAMMA25-1016 [hydrothermal vent metagenome]|uniref:Type II secretion system protein H n=1 Tax=hydrothermal vent metagenome TaxID=652676 RepID=A0A3B1BYP7_9ZZZZ
MKRRQSDSAFSLQQGFTLIEILVVMILLGIVMTIAVISIGNSQSEQLEEDMRRLLQIARLTHEEAIINQQTLAIKFSKHGYSIQRFEAQGRVWIPVTEPAFFLPKELDESYEIKLFQDGLSVSLEENDSEKEDSGKVLMYSSGEMTPFELTISLPDSEIEYRLTADLMGKLEIEDLQAYGSTLEEDEQ